MTFNSISAFKQIKHIKEAKSFVYELTRETINKEIQLENFYKVIETLSQVIEI